MDRLPEPSYPNVHALPALQEVLVNDDIYLRPMEESDAEALLAILEADPTIRRRVSVANRLHTPEDVAQEVTVYRADPHMIRYVISSGGRVVGLVNLWRDDGTMTGIADLDACGFGYFLDPAERGKGLVARAVQALMQAARVHLHPQRFVAYCEDDNTDSIAVLTRLGFELTNQATPDPENGWVERKYIRPA